MSRSASRRIGISLALLAMSIAMGSEVAPASAAPATELGPSGLPLPRFVSLKSSRVNLRIGPGRTYPVEWMYLKAGLPVEIIQEYDTWRRVRDAEGTEGWINQSLLSGKRTGLAAPWQRGKEALLTLHDAPDDTSASIATVEPGSVGVITACNGEWCAMEFDGHAGWLRQALVWGAYPGEQLDD